jgi:hypothetical protein
MSEKQFHLKFPTSLIPIQLRQRHVSFSGVNSSWTFDELLVNSKWMHQGYSAHDLHELSHQQFLLLRLLLLV